MGTGTAFVFGALVAVAQAFTIPAPEPEVPKAQADSHEAEIALAEYSDCVVRSDGRRALALRYLRVAVGTPEATELNEKLSTPDCLLRAIPKSVTPTGGERSDRRGRLDSSSIDVYTLSMAPAAYRNALYPALYRHSFGETGPGAITDKLPLSVASEWDEVPDPLPDGWLVRRAIGDCVVRGHPRAAHRFVVSTPWSDAETAEMNEIAAALAECLPAGETVRLGREDVRGIVGEALYKLAVAPAPSGEAS